MLDASGRRVLTRVSVRCEILQYPSLHSASTLAVLPSFIVQLMQWPVA